MSERHVELLAGTIGLAVLFGASVLTRVPIFVYFVVMTGGYLLGRADGMRQIRRLAVASGTRDTG